MRHIKKIHMESEIIGTKNFHGSVDITDPFYYRNVWCRMNDVKIKEGDYTCVAWRHTDQGVFQGKPYTDTRVGCLGIYLDGRLPDETKMERIGNIGVDAGMAGFFHEKPDYSDTELIHLCNVICENGDVWLTDDGFFSNSGYGDGGYDVFAWKEQGEITAIEIRFL